MAREISLCLNDCMNHRRIAGREFLNLEIPTSRPVRRWNTLRRGLGLVLNFKVLFHSLQTDTLSD